MSGETFAYPFPWTPPMEMPAALRVRGREGRTLAETWQGSPQAYVGTAIAGFPNLFMLMGPNTGLGHNSVVYMIESQLAYVLDALAAMRERAAATVEVRPEVQTAYNAEVQQRLEGTVWASGCKSWYQDSHGRNTALWPGFTFGLARRGCSGWSGCGSNDCDHSGSGMGGSACGLRNLLVPSDVRLALLPLHLSWGTTCSTRCFRGPQHGASVIVGTGLGVNCL